jgi:hypothetical protein
LSVPVYDALGRCIESRSYYSGQDVREVITERAAIQNVIASTGGLSPQQIAHSTNYIEYYQQRVMALGGARVP